MILFLATGIAAWRLWDWEAAAPLGALAGLLVAPLVPVKKQG